MDSHTFDTMAESHQAQHKPHASIADPVGEGAPFQRLQCHKCQHFSALIGSLWQRISELEGQLYQASMEKGSAETVVQALLRLHAKTEGQLSRTFTERITAETVVRSLLCLYTGNVSPGLEPSFPRQCGSTDCGSPTSVNRSFGSDDSLIQLDPEDGFSAPKEFKSIVKGTPLWDLLGSCKADSTFDSSASEPLVPQTVFEGKCRREKSSGDPHQYIHHFEENFQDVSKNLVTSAQRVARNVSKKRTIGSLPSQATLPVAQPLYTSSDEADSEGSSNPNKYASANPPFDDPSLEADSRKDANTALSRGPLTRSNDDVCGPPNAHLQTIPEGWEQSALSEKSKHTGANKNLEAAKANRNVDVSSFVISRPPPRASGDTEDLGLRFVPRPTDLYLYRTVVISGLSPHCSLSQVLEQVRGGLVVNAVLADTISLIGTMSAYVSFFEERYAVAYEAFVKANVVEVANHRISANLVPTATWPLTLGLRRSVREQRHTRCLEIENFPRQILPSTLRKHLEVAPALKCDSIEHLAMDNRGILQLRFNSILAAQHAYDTLFLRFRKLPIRFALDPCDQPISVDFAS